MQISRFKTPKAFAVPLIGMLAALVLGTASMSRAQAPTAPAVEADEPEVPDSRAGGSAVFKANEGMLIRIPLDSNSVLNGAYPIDSAGYANLPVVGRLYVHDRSATELEGYLGKRMSQYLRDTHIMATPVIRLTLLGHWQRPGMHYVDPEASVWEACRLVGGPAGEQNIQEWRVMRGSTDMTIALLDEFSRGSSLRKAGIHSGDLFIIPQPNQQAGFWYWFRETLTVTAQVAAIAGTSLTVYLTYLALEDRQNAP